MSIAGDPGGDDIYAAGDRLGAEPTVLFSHTVQEGDLDTDGVSIGTNAFSLNGGSIWDKIGNYATNPTHEALPPDERHKAEAPHTPEPAKSMEGMPDEPVSPGMLLSHTLIEYCTLLCQGAKMWLATGSHACDSSPVTHVPVQIQRLFFRLRRVQPLRDATLAAQPAIDRRRASTVQHRLD